MGRGPAGYAADRRLDLYTLVGQFTALRHEVNMQTRAARAAVEQTAEVLEAADPRRRRPTDAADDHLRPLAKAVIDIADALALSLRQMEKLREAAEPLWTLPSRGRRPGGAPPGSSPGCSGSTGRRAVPERRPNAGRGQAPARSPRPPPTGTP